MKTSNQVNNLKCLSKTFSTIFIIGLIILLTNAVQLKADIITLNAIDSGWYNSSTGHDPSNENYFAGEYIPTQKTENRNFFVFDLSSVNVPVVAASLKIYSGSYTSQDNSEIYRLHEVTTPINDLRNNTGDIATTFEDLGSGEILGRREIFSSEANSEITIDLNPAGISYLNNSDGLIAFGGRVPTIGTSHSFYEYIFGSTGKSSTRQLTIETIPEPATISLFVLGFLGMLKRRKQ